MPSLPKSLSGSEVVKALSKAGFVFKRQKGSHVILVKELGGMRFGCVVPLHKELKAGTLHGILKQAKLSEEEFLKLI